MYNMYVEAFEIHGIRNCKIQIVKTNWRISLNGNNLRGKTENNEHEGNCSE